MTIAGDAFLSVVIASVGGAAVIVSLYSLGVRFVTDAELLAPKAAKGDGSAVRKESFFRSIAYICFTLCAIAVLYEIYLIIPFFHK